MRTVRAHRLPRLLAGLAAVLTGASLLHRPLAAQAVAEVQVTPETLTLGVGQRQTIFATAYDRQGNLIPNAQFTFWSSDTSVARIGREGAVTGVSPGLAKVEARVQGQQASMAVLVTGPGAGSPPDSVPSGTVLTLEPSSAVLLPGESVVVLPQAVRENGTAVNLGRVAWKSLRPEVAAVDSAGLVVAVTPGRSIIQAAASGLMATMPVEVAAAELALSESRLVLAPGDTDTLRALVPVQGNREVRRGVQWRSSDSSVVGAGSTGIVTAHGPGRADIVLTGFGQERRAAVLVHREPSALVVTPRPTAGVVQVPIRSVRRVTAYAEAADSTPIPEAQVTWEVGDTALIAYDVAKGELTGKALGSTTLTARLEGFEPAVWTVEVTPGTLGFDRRRVGLGRGERDTLRGILFDEEGKPIGGLADLEWSSDKPDVVRVSPGGVIEGVGTGRAVVSATATWGKRASADVFVVDDLLVSSNRGGRFGIYQMRSGVPDTLRPLLSDSFTNVQPALSPDRTRIAFSAHRDESYDLYLMDADGGNVRRLTTDPGNEGEPTWTPDGSRIIYTASAKGEPPRLFSLRPDGNPPEPIPGSMAGNHSPAISPDGRTLAFISSRDGNQEVYLMPIDSGETRRLTRTDQREATPRFLPNGDLLFSVDRGRAKGSRVIRVPRGVEEGEVVLETEHAIVGLAVSRDGARLAYVVNRLTDASRGRARFDLFVRPLAKGSTATAVALRPGEQVASPSF